MIAIELKGRKALVTGGDSGLGAATVKSLAQAGADVAITYRYESGAAPKLMEMSRRVISAMLSLRIGSLAPLRMHTKNRA